MWYFYIEFSEKTPYCFPWWLLGPPFLRGGQAEHRGRWKPRKPAHPAVTCPFLTVRAVSRKGQAPEVPYMHAHTHKPRHVLETSFCNACK